MRRLKATLLATVLGVSFFAMAPKAEAHNPYWRNHWGWYNNTYRPYYHRNYYYGPSYYSGAYYSPYGGYYNRGYGGYGGYYGGTDVGVGVGGAGIGVGVGPVGVGWW